MNKQHTEILQILKTSRRGMNSFEWRTNYIQLPVRIKELKDMGWLIVSRKNRDKSVNYVLVSNSNTQPSQPLVVPQKAEQPWEKPTIKVWSDKFQRWTWEEVKEPEQISL